MQSLKKLVTIAAPVVALTIFAAPARAQAAFAASHPTAAPARVRIDDAQQLATEGKFRAAEKAFRSLAREQRESGAYPAAALRGLANALYAQGETRRAAGALDELSTAAAEFGDPETQIVAMLDASLLYQQVGDKAEVASRIPRITTLLKSPVIGAATRDLVTARLEK
jgi:hypothetical protein